MYTREEKIQILKWYFGGHSNREIVNLFIIAFENRPVPTQSAISRIIQKFEKCGCIQNCRKCKNIDLPRARTVSEVRQNKEIDVCAVAETSDPCSSRTIAEQCNMNDRTVRNILKRNGYHCYKVQTTQELLPEDNIRRMEFCEIMMERENQDNNFLKNILFTDESTFSLHRKHNSSTVRYWSRDNKHLSIAVRTQRPQKHNVWTGVVGDYIIGPFFIDGNLTGDKYLELLQNQIIPTLRLLPINFEDIWFQQDGCPAHNRRAVQNYLETTFNNKLISTRGTIKWPPRSPDLSPNDFFLWGYLKEEVYRHSFERARNLEELRQKIIHFCGRITPQQLRDMRLSLYNRFGYCLAERGGLFEPLLK